MEAVRLLKLFICVVKHTWTIERIALTSGEQLYTEEYLNGKRNPFCLGKIFLVLYICIHHLRLDGRLTDCCFFSWVEKLTNFKIFP